MLDEETGFNNIERGRQKILFKGIKRIRNIRPTDIDGVMGYGKQVFVWFEGKVKGTLLSTGQKRLFRDLSEVIRDGGSKAYCVIFEHEVPITKDVVMKDQLVSEYYNSSTSQWHTPKKSTTVLEAIDLIEEYEKIKRIKNK